jgi:hypothetical protein
MGSLLVILRAWYILRKAKCQLCQVPGQKAQGRLNIQWRCLLRHVHMSNEAV